MDYASSHLQVGQWGGGRSATLTPGGSFFLTVHSSRFSGRLSWRVPVLWWASPPQASGGPNKPAPTKWGLPGAGPSDGALGCPTATTDCAGEHRAPTTAEPARRLLISQGLAALLTK